MGVRIEINEEGRIAAQIPYAGGRGRDAAKRIPGHRPKIINDKFAYWHYPLTMETCRLFRKEFGNALSIGPKLTEWAWDERRRVEELEKLRAGSAADLPRVREEAPRLWAAMQTRPFQIAGAAFVVKANGAILGDEMRLGKTYQALATIVERGASTILIASPKTATYAVWYRKAAELIGIEPYVAQGSRAQRERAIAEFIESEEPRKILVINLEMMRTAKLWVCPNGTQWKVPPRRKRGCKEAHEHKIIYQAEYPQLFDIDWDMTILDESHHALASQYNIQSDNITQIRLGAVRLPIRPDGLRLAMSGTPFRSKTTKAWGSLNWIRPDIFSSFWRYAETLYDVRDDEWGRKVIGGLKSEEALTDTLRPYYIARTKADVAPYLPPVVYAGSPPFDDPDGPVGVYLPMDEKQEKAYQSILEDAAARVENGVIRANGVLAELTRLRQFASAYGKLSHGKFVFTLPSNKYDWVLDYVREMYESSDTAKVVIASQFTELVKLFANGLLDEGYEVLTLTGETSAARRAVVQDQFLTGSPRIIIINLFAGGEAIDLSSADDLILLDEPWTDDPRQQVEARVSNLAKRQQVTIHRLRSSGTIEETVAAMADEQRRLLTSARPKALAIAKDILGDAA